MITETLAVIFQGYFIVPTTGNYLFETVSDDFGFIWVGVKAFKEWYGYNYDGKKNTTSSPVFLTEGERVPTTFLYANGGGVCKSIFDIILPDGTPLNGNLQPYFSPPLSTDPWLPTPRTTCPPAPLYDNYNFRLTHAGSSYTLDPNNPSNTDPDHPPIAKTYSQGANFASVRSDCEARANTYGYMTLDIYFSIPANAWLCTLYWYPNDLNVSYTVPSTTTTQSHGYVSGSNGDVPYLDCSPQEPDYVDQFFSGFARLLNATTHPSDCEFTLDEGYTYLDACSAVLACTSDAENWGYETVELYLQETESVWVCVEYYKQYTRGEEFEVVNSTVGQVFGYMIR